MGKVLPLVLLLAPSLLAQAVDDPPQCASCCPPVEPVPDTVACDTLDTHLDMIEEAIEEAQCDDSSGGESDEVCHAITMKAIPPCMLMEGASEQAACLAEAAQDIEEELNTGEEAGTEVVAKCKCDAFKKIRKALSSVRDMMCAPSSSDDRTSRNYYGYGANTLWFQYLLCQDESIPSLACWLFTSGWNQADYGQYYLYDNLLGEDGAALGLDGHILPLLALSGGLGGGAYGGYAHGGHALYRREVNDDNACPNGEERNAAGQCPSRKRRETPSPCPSGDRNPDGSCKDRKRRETCPSGDRNPDGSCKDRKRRDTCSSGDRNPDGSCKDRKRRETPCPSGRKNAAT